MGRQIDFTIIGWLTIIPVLLPLLLSSFTLVLRNFDRFAIAITALGFVLQLFFCALLLAFVLENGSISMTMGEWLAPFGISFIADIFSSLLCLIANFIAFMVFIYSLSELNAKQRSFGFISLLLLLLAGVNGAFLTGDIFNLYVWFEVMLISSLGLLVYGGSKSQFDGGIKYAILNLLATSFLLISIALLYGQTGSLNIAKLSLLSSSGFDYNFTGYLFIFALGIKSAMFPLFFWLPAAYHVPYNCISACFAALLTKVGVYCLYRIYTSFLYNQTEHFELILFFGLASLFTGSLMCISERNLRRQFGFLVISGIGMILVALGLNSRISLAAGSFYFIHSMLLMASLYMIAGLINRREVIIGRDCGYHSRLPYVSVLALISFFTSSGFPPFSGFWPKIMLLKEAWFQGRFMVVSIILLSSFFIMIGLLRSYSLLFWRSDVGGASSAISHSPFTNFTAQLCVAIFVFTLVMIGLFPDILGSLSFAIADSLKNPADYITTVLPDAKGAL